MFWLRNKKIIFLLHTLNLTPVFGIQSFNDNFQCSVPILIHVVMVSFFQRNNRAMEHGVKEFVKIVIKCIFACYKDPTFYDFSFTGSGESCLNMRLPGALVQIVS